MTLHIKLALYELQHMHAVLILSHHVGKPVKKGGTAFNTFFFSFFIVCSIHFAAVAAFQHPPVAYQDAIWQSLIKMLIHFNKRQVINCNYVSSERWQRAGV